MKTLDAKPDPGVRWRLLRGPESGQNADLRGQLRCGRLLKLPAEAKAGAANGAGSGPTQVDPWERHVP